MKQMVYENKKPTPGQLVHIMIDRPMNSYHPEHKDLFYPVNYGYIEGSSLRTARNRTFMFWGSITR